MAEDLIVLDGSSFFYTEPSGDIDAQHHEGYFFEDVRHLARWQLTLDGSPPQILTTVRPRSSRARIVGCAEDKPLSVFRDRTMEDGVRETITIENRGREPERVRLELRFGSDFADVREAQEKGVIRSGRRWVDLGSRALTIWCERRGYRRGTRLRFNRACTLRRDRARFDVELPPRRSWTLQVELHAIVDGRSLRVGPRRAAREPGMRLEPEQWLAQAPALEAESETVFRTYRESLLDLASLRLRPSPAIEWALPAGGLPWFMTLFGRDSLWASFEALPFQPHLARATLRALAESQATSWDDFADAEPGKILHELRRGTLAKLGVIPQLYYGSHDSTPLFLIVLDEYERWTGDLRLVRELEPAARSALAWMEGPGDLDGDGFLEYRSRSSSPGALRNQGWKDSGDGIVAPDGSLPPVPLATCELQGYAYQARLRLARLARLAYRDEQLADRLERDAAELATRFEDRFWLGRRGFHALALDRDKRPVATLTSNLGHLLWSEIVEPERAARIVRLLLREDLFSGWGIRSLSAREPSFDPLAYHRGTVWPMDTIVAAAGMRRYGFLEEAARLIEALFDSAEAFAYRLPEVFSGYARNRSEVPIEYPGAMKPQAWSAGAPLLALRILLGLEVEDGSLQTGRRPPAALGRIRLRGLQVRGKRHDV